MWRLSLLVLSLFAFSANAQTDNDAIRPSAKPRFQVVDGHTVKFGPQLVKMFGIDAPEKGQTCDDGQWQPGPLAKKALENFIAGRPVSCKQVDHDGRNNPPVAQCFAGNDDLQALMVAAGWAWSFGRYSDRYAPEEAEARRGMVGVHAHRCVPPWEWRAQQKAKAGQWRPREVPPLLCGSARQRFLTAQLAALAMGAGDMIWPTAATLLRFVIAAGGSLLALDVFGWGAPGLYACVAAGIIAYAVLLAVSMTQRAWHTA